MSVEIKRVFIAGGTGFIGYHAAKLFLERKVIVDSIALASEIILDDFYPKEIKLNYGNLFLMSEDEIMTLFSHQSYDVLIYALGPDDRLIPQVPAYEFFYDKLVLEANKICNAAKKAGIKKCIICNSYFSYFDQLYKGRLSKTHPYIKARVQQISILEKLASDDFEMIFLQLPYIFGIMPHRKPLWKEHFLDQFATLKAVVFPCGGGTAAIDVGGVAEYIYAAAKFGTTGCYLVGQENFTYRKMIKIMMKASKDHRLFISLPGWLCAFWANKIHQNLLHQGLESGLHYGKLMTQIQNKRFYVDNKDTRLRLHFEELGFFGGRDVSESIKTTIESCYLGEQ